jgi:Ca-activated chloride channel family protein
MKATTYTTLALFGAASAATGALLLHRHSADGPKAAAAPNDVTCGTVAPSHAEGKLTHGKLTGAMSAGTLLRGSGGETFAAFELTTDEIKDATRPPLDLALVIDRSGSMSGRINYAQDAAVGIVDHLGAQDHVALIQYDDSADVVVASTAMDDKGKTAMKSAIRSISLGGGTNLHGGLVLGRDEVQRVYTQGQVSRVILLSDGQANVGVVDPQQIAATARDAANHGTRITTVGVGLDYNEDLMEAIAESGRGNYHYVKEAKDLERVIAGELAGIQATVATNVELRLTPVCPGVQITEVHGYESRRDGAAFVVPMADLIGHDSRKLLVSMKVPDGQKGHVAALRAELVYKDAKGTDIKKSELALGVDISEDATVAAASVDQNVMAQALQVQAAASMRQAAQAYERGDQEAARTIVESTAAQVEQKRALYKIAPAKTAETMKSLDDMSKKAVMYKPGSYEGKDMLKASKSKARVMSKH